MPSASSSSNSAHCARNLIGCVTKITFNFSSFKRKVMRILDFVCSSNYNDFQRLLKIFNIYIYFFFFFERCVALCRKESCRQSYPILFHIYSAVMRYKCSIHRDVQYEIKYWSQRVEPFRRINIALFATAHDDDRKTNVRTTIKTLWCLINTPLFPDELGARCEWSTRRGEPCRNLG